MIDQLIDAIAWAKTCVIVAAATAPESTERARRAADLREAVAEPRRVVDEVFGKGQSLPRNLIIELRTCELAIPKLEDGAVLRQSEGAA